MEDYIRKATWLELFYDLVFVVAIAKAVHTLGHAHHGHLGADQYLYYVLLIIPLWWAWTGHTLFANRFDTDDVPQRLLTLAQMACVASMAVFIGSDIKANFLGFLLSYVTFRGLLVLMYWRIALTDKGECNVDVARLLANAFTPGVLISLSSLLFSAPWKYLIFNLGIIIDIVMPLILHKKLMRMPVQAHHLPERYGLLTIILLGESVAILVATIAATPPSLSAHGTALAGFIWTAAIWWIYYENLEHRIYGRELGTGQTAIYLHLLIYATLGGIANTIHYAINPTLLSLFDYKLLAGSSTILFVIALELLHLNYHHKSERGAVLRNGVILLGAVGLATWLSPSHQVILLALAVIFVGYAINDAIRRHSQAGE
jgi:low temperature requirement protein LtrA